MLKNLFIENIPPNKKSLMEVLELIGDNSWSTDHIEYWISVDVNHIYYSTKNKNYVFSTKDTKIGMLKNELTVIDYKNIINQKPIDELKINEVSIFKDINDNRYEVLRVQNGYIYTNKLGNMCFVPSNNILI